MVNFKRTCPNVGRNNCLRAIVVGEGFGTRCVFRNDIAVAATE